MSVFDSATQFGVKVEVTEESAMHHAILVGNGFTKNRVVVYLEEIEEFMENLKEAHEALLENLPA